MIENMESRLTEEEEKIVNYFETILQKKLTMQS